MTVKGISGYWVVKVASGVSEGSWGVQVAESDLVISGYPVVVSGEVVVRANFKAR